jgi:hypothetical protein
MPLADTRPRAIPVIAFSVAAIVVSLTVGLVLHYGRPAGRQDTSAAPTEAKAYVRNLELGEVSMHASESFMRQQLVEVEGRITNHGTRSLKVVDVYCLFYSPAGQEIHRERSAIVAAKTTPLSPGQTRTFRLPFDALPDGWNQAVPRMVIASIVFAD